MNTNNCCVRGVDQRYLWRWWNNDFIENGALRIVLKSALASRRGSLRSHGFYLSVCQLFTHEWGVCRTTWRTCVRAERSERIKCKWLLGLYLVSLWCQNYEMKCSYLDLGRDNVSGIKSQDISSPVEPQRCVLSLFSPELITTRSDAMVGYNMCLLRPDGGQTPQEAAIAW